MTPSRKRSILGKAGLTLATTLALSSAWSAYASCGSLFGAASEASAREEKRAERRVPSPALQTEETWQDLVRDLEDHTNVQLAEPFEIRARTGREAPRAVKYYSKARFVVSKSVPTNAPTILTRLEFGYVTGGGFRASGQLEYISIGPDGQVIEVGAKSQELLDEFKTHLFGRTLSPADAERITQLNTRLFADLRAYAGAREYLRQFVKKRGWPEGLTVPLEERGQIAYFDADDFDLRGWSEKNGYSPRDLRDAGWVTQKFDDQGRPIYRVFPRESIRIPFFAPDGKIVAWRTRSLDPNAKSKYLSWPKDRSLENPIHDRTSLYRGWELGRAQGKTIVITEGEFKCLVASLADEIVTVGIPGISEFGPAALNAILAAKAAQIVVLLDRDPKAKGFFRADGITDSERAAYNIARELQQAGAPNVRVARLPDLFDGDKVGIDDLILANPSRVADSSWIGIAGYRRVVAEATTPDAFAAALGIDPKLTELLTSRSKIKKAIDRYETSQAAGGPAVPQPIYDRALSAFGRAASALEKYLRTKFKAKSINQPSVLYPYIPAIPFKQRRTAPNARLDLRDGGYLNSGAFEEDMLLLDFVPADESDKRCSPAPCSKLPFTDAEIRAAIGGATATNPELAKDLSRTARVSSAAGARLIEKLLAGHLARDFPPDEYGYEFDAKVLGGGSGPITIPLTLVKRSSGTVAAFARLRLRDDGPVAPAGAPDFFRGVQSVLRP